MTHEAAREALAWYVNDTLEDAERNAFEAHLALCPACTREVAAERRLVEALRAVPLEDALVAAAQARVLAEIDRTEASARAGGRRRVRRTAPDRRRSRGLAGIVAGVALAGAAVLGLVVGLDARWGSSRPGGDAAAGFETLTTPGAAAGVTLRIKLDPGLGPAAAEAIAARHGLDVVGRSERAGLYTMAGEGPGAALADALRAEPAVRFVMVGGGR
ncbi:MAG: anti-sigma factor family protein [Paracoccaceae bacterium]